MSTFLPTITEAEARQQALIFRALGDPVRIAILNLLKTHGGQIDVQGITDNFNLEQPSVSHHLSILKNAGLIDYHKRGLHVYYLIRAEAVARAHASIAALQEVSV